jgi:hypothetical protein
MSSFPVPPTCHVRRPVDCLWSDSRIVRKPVVVPIRQTTSPLLKRESTCSFLAMQLNECDASGFFYCIPLTLIRMTKDEKGLAFFKGLLL